MTPNLDHQRRLPGHVTAPCRKRGVLLLVVLSLLTLFMLLGTTYMVVTSRARATARAFARAAEASHSAQSAAGRRFVDEAFLAVARGPSQPPATWTFTLGEDLLGDKYGYASSSSSAPPDRQVLTGTLTSGSALNPSSTLVLVPVKGPVASASPETLAGRVITFLLPDFTWSTRILRARGTTGGPTTAVVISLAAVSGSRSATLSELNAAIAKAPTAANSPPHCIVNTREFVGTAGTDANEPYDGFDTANPFLAQIVETPEYSPTKPVSVIGTGSCVRASYQSTGNALRVDNDGDGVLDSCWLDFGLPVVRDATGVVCKPKAAVLVLDLDGRLNVNAHGSPAEVAMLQAPGSLQWPAATPQLPPSLSAAEFAALPIGSGYGPPEVRLADVLLVSSTSTAAATANLLLSGTSLTPTATEYGSAKRPILSATNAWGRYGDAGVNPLPGVSGTDDALSAIQDQQRARTSDGKPARGQSLCNDWRVSTPLQQWQASPDDFTSPPDLNGRMKVFADLQAPGDGVVARMRYAKPIVGGNSWWKDDTKDDPYEVRLDRRSAADATFGPDELERLLRIYDWDAAQLPVRLAALLGPDAERLRLLLTSESWDTTAIVGPARKKIEAALAKNTAASTWAEVFAPELIGGRKLDINRPVQSAAEKDLLCRQLYTLLWALTGSSDSKAMAQWAVNVVDFRDADSTMTRFAYDKDPTDGWTPGTDVVWGVERPDLLIGEALAWQSEGGKDGGVYVSLHHPWASKAIEGNKFAPVGMNTDMSAWVDPDAVDPALDASPMPKNVLNLDARGGGDPDSPVWRLRVGDKVGDPVIRLDNRPQASTDDAFWSDPKNSPSVDRQVPPDGSFCVFGESKPSAGGKIDVDTAFGSSAQLKIDSRGSSPSSLKPSSTTSITVILERLADPTKKFVAGTNEYVEVDRVDSLKVADRTPVPLSSPPQPLEQYAKKYRMIDFSTPGTFWKRVYQVENLDSVAINKQSASPRVACMPWLNRPYISVAELALVPPWDATTLLDQYSGFAGNGMLDKLKTKLSQPPEFLANLFETVTVPTRFSGINTTIDEYPAGQNPLEVPSSNADCDPGLDKLPINQLTGCREPGRVNLNTVSDQRIWEATVLRGPRSLGTSTVGNTTIDWSSSNLGRPGAAAQPATSALQLLALKGGTSSTTVSGTVVADTADPGPDPAGNPQFQYLTANRLANVATTRSHVFAVWVTIGFFDPVTDQELGTDTGNVQRHRGFFIFDRSIPVGYETGKDHNVRDAILLRRIIQ
jgi:hypothetical protein